MSNNPLKESVAQTAVRYQEAANNCSLRAQGCVKIEARHAALHWQYEAREFAKRARFALLLLVNWPDLGE